MVSCEDCICCLGFLKKGYTHIYLVEKQGPFLSLQKREYHCTVIVQALVIINTNKERNH